MISAEAQQIIEQHRSDGKRFCYARSYGEIMIKHSDGREPSTKSLICSLPYLHAGDHVDGVCCWRSHRFTEDMATSADPTHRNTERCVGCGSEWPCDVARLVELIGQPTTVDGTPRLGHQHEPWQIRDGGTGPDGPYGPYCAACGEKVPPR